MVGCEGLLPAVTCKRSWESFSGNRWDFMVGCPSASAAVLSVVMDFGRWLQAHLAVRAFLIVRRGVPPLWLAAWLSAVDKGGGSESVEFQRAWEVYDDRLQFMAIDDAFRLDDALRGEDVSEAWTAWSDAGEGALVDAYCFAGSPVPSGSLVRGRGVARCRVRHGGPKVLLVGMYLCTGTLLPSWDAG